MLLSTDDFVPQLVAHAFAQRPFSALNPLPIRMETRAEDIEYLLAGKFPLSFQLHLSRPRGVVRLERRIIVFVYVDFTFRGRDEGPPRVENTALPPVCFYGVGGPLKNHQWYTVISMQPAATVAPAGGPARRRFA